TDTTTGAFCFITTDLVAPPFKSGMNCSHRWAVLHHPSPPAIGGTTAYLERVSLRRSATERTSTFHQDRNCLSLRPKQSFSKLERDGEDDFCSPFHHPRHPTQTSLSRSNSCNHPPHLD
ncbi:hypothetical protein V3C99_006252, partial [Haemonchus contortus]